MKVLGITGGIGSGKSVVSNLLKIIGVPVYNSDVEAKKITASSLLVQKKISEKFGSQLYSEGELNKALFASLIFNNPNHLAFANSVIHPEVYADFLEWKKKHSSCIIVGIESAILFESGFNKYVDTSVSVSSELELRIQRVQKRDALDRISILNRMNNQMSEITRNLQSDYTIINDDIQAVLPQVEKLLKQIES